jgi:hypothetical protein
MNTTRPDHRVIGFAETVEHQLLPKLTDTFGNYFGQVSPATISVEVANSVSRLERRIEHALTVITYATEVERRTEWARRLADKGVA